MDSAACSPSVRLSIADYSTNERPALAQLIRAMARLARTKRLEIARLDRRAAAAKHPRLRELARAAKAEAKRLAMAQAA